MVLRLETQIKIDNPRHYSVRTVEDLHAVLLAGGPKQRDPRRKHFYEIEGPDANYYIYISPITGQIVLLAKWQRQPQEACIGEVNLVA
jgi:hypothetical protein